jgi:hypothetical protein
MKFIGVFFSLILFSLVACKRDEPARPAPRNNSTAQRSDDVQELREFLKKRPTARGSSKP